MIISAAPPLKKAFLLPDELSVNLGGSAVYPPLQLGITNIANNGQAQLAVVIDGDDDDEGNGWEKLDKLFPIQRWPLSGHSEWSKEPQQEDAELIALAVIGHIAALNGYYDGQLLVDGTLGPGADDSEHHGGGQHRGEEGDQQPEGGHQGGTRWFEFYPNLLLSAGHFYNSQISRLLEFFWILSLAICWRMMWEQYLHKCL